MDGMQKGGCGGRKTDGSSYAAEKAEHVHTDVGLVDLVGRM